MMLSDVWKTYMEGDYLGSLRGSVEGFANTSGIDLLHIAGLSLMNLHRRDEALILLKAAITLRPQAPHIYTNAAFVAEQAGLKHEAEWFAHAGLLDFPDDSDLLLLKANSLVMQMRFDDAEVMYRRLLERDPTHVQSILNLGNIARAKEDFAEAMRWYDRVEAIEPDFRDLIFARATMHCHRGEDGAAIELLEPIGDDVNAQFLLSLLYLARGDYERGFRMYRARSNTVWYNTGHFVYPINPFDHWSEAAGQRIAIIQEGGFGDMLQFVRYIPMLADVAETITLYSPPLLHRLFSHNMPANVSVRFTYDDYVPANFDYVTTDVEMPYHFRTTLASIPDRCPYLLVPRGAIEARRLPETSLKRVGLCWAGGERDELNQRSYDYRRSFDLETYAPLGAIPGIEFVGLQMGQRAEQTCEALPLTRVLEPSFDFLDTAAIIMQLDLVITVDTAVAHLAASIGKPVWVLSRYDCCWRWLKNRPESPWYPGVLRVFGQKVYRDWSHPLNEVAEALAEWVSTEPPGRA